MDRARASRVATFVAVLGLGAVLAWGDWSFPSTHASTTTSRASASIVSPPAPNSNGFAAVAKSVTPAVVNITASARTSGRHAMEIPEKNGGTAWKNSSDPPSVLTLLEAGEALIAENHEVRGWDPASSSPPMGIF